MPLIVDCNNFLHAPKPASLAGLDELGLCRALARTGWRGEGVRLICDGAPGPLAEVHSPVTEIEILYAGPGREADEVIERLIAEDTAPRRLVVVSSDRRIQRAAQRRRARSWTSERFAHELSAALAAGRGKPPDPGTAPDAHLPADQVRRWLEMFGYDPNDTDSEDEEDESKHWPPW